MTDNIVSFDLETTGLNTQTDHIIQIGLVKFNKSTYEELGHLMFYIKPGVGFSIDPYAQEKHGLTKEFILENGVLLSSVWDEIREFIGDCDILSYNGNSFDVPMLYNNLVRYNLEFDFVSRKYYDSMIVERKRVRYKLADTYKRYTGKELEGAHDALEDVRATVQVFKHQLEQAPEMFDDSEFTMISPEGFIKLNDNNELVFTSGKYRGRRTNDICRTDPSYIRWIVEKFSPITVETIKNAWIVEKEANQAKDNL